MLKYILVYSISAVGFIACQQRVADRQTSPEELLQGETNKVIGFDNTIRRSLSDVWLNTASFCPSQRDAGCARQLNELQHRLNDLNPVPVPQSAEDRPVTTAEATRLYRNFVAEHTGEPVLTIFQQLYPRILLNKYGVLASNDYGLIAYYTHQLTASDALDFDTRTRALSILNGNLPAEEYVPLLAKTREAVAKELTCQQEEIARLKKIISADPKKFIPGDPSTYAAGFNKTLLEHYETSTLSANKAELDKLQHVGDN